MASKVSSSKVSPEWRKRVSIEYARLRAQKKFRHQDDIKMSWNSNRDTIERNKESEEVSTEGRRAEDVANEGTSVREIPQASPRNRRRIGHVAATAPDG